MGTMKPVTWYRNLRAYSLASIGLLTQTDPRIMHYKRPCSIPQDKYSVMLLPDQIKEGEERLEYAFHYRSASCCHLFIVMKLTSCSYIYLYMLSLHRIPYPRLRHASQFPKRYFMQAPAEDAAGSRLSNQ